MNAYIKQNFDKVLSFYVKLYLFYITVGNHACIYLEK